MNRERIEKVLRDRYLTVSLGEATSGDTFSEVFARIGVDALVAAGLLRTEGTDPHPEKSRKTSYLQIVDDALKPYERGESRGDGIELAYLATSSIGAAYAIVNALVRADPLHDARAADLRELRANAVAIELIPWIEDEATRYAVAADIVDAVGIEAQPT